MSYHARFHGFNAYLCFFKGYSKGYYMLERVSRRATSKGYPNGHCKGSCCIEPLVVWLDGNAICLLRAYPVKDLRLTLPSLNPKHCKLKTLRKPIFPFPSPKP